MERSNGYFGQFGGSYVPESLGAVLKELEESFYFTSILTIPISKKNCSTTINNM